MQLPLQVTFRNMSPSELVEADVRKRAAKLDEFYDRIMSCRIMVELHNPRHRQGNLYHVRVDLTVPNGEIVASRASPEHHAHEDVYVAIRDAFDAVERQLEDYSRRQRADVKTHETPSHGRVAQLFPERSAGIIETADGREINFHRNAVLEDAFDKLTIGSEVRFTEQPVEEEGPWASTVRLMGKHHISG
ncbi:MAG: HPF/RaiA family ribosome-associated protein [Gammaproteobacteria bacterium]